MLSTIKVIAILAVAFFVARPWLLRRWPDFTRRINFALIASLIAVLLFRLMIWFSRS